MPPKKLLTVGLRRSKIVCATHYLTPAFLLSRHTFAGYGRCSRTSWPGKARQSARVHIGFLQFEKAKEYEYLEVSIPEALIEPLNDTGKFEVLNRSTWNKLSGAAKLSAAELFDEEKAAALGAAADADVVVIGKFVVQGNTLQIQIKAVEVSSKRAMVSRSDNALTDSSMFTTIATLTNKVSKDMAKRLPPLPQRVIYQDRIKSKEQAEEVKAAPQPEEKKGPKEITYPGILWRTAILPGFGHVYAEQKRGWLYVGLFLGTGGAFIWSHFNYRSKQDAYNSATSDFDSKYDSANGAYKLRGYLSFAVIGVVAFIWGDALLFGKQYVRTGTVVTWDFYSDRLGSQGLVWSYRF